MSQPGEWLGLLKWSLAYTDGTGETTAKEMDSEKRAWLEAAMKELVVDEAKLAKESVDELQELSLQTELGDQSIERATELFEQVEDIAESLDTAFDLVKMGCMNQMVEMLRSKHPFFRRWAAQIVATVAQNNPQCQAGLLQLGALAYTTHICVHDHDPGARLKALLAVSCLIRNCKDGERAFVDQGDGILVLANGLKSTESRLAAKAVHLLLFLLTEDTMLRDEHTLAQHHRIFTEANGQGLVEALISNEDVNARHGALQLLGRLGALSAEAIKKLEARLDELTKEQGEQDEIDMIKGLITSNK